jgi:S1-C subfamily serine protease
MLLKLIGWVFKTVYSCLKGLALLLLCGVLVANIMSVLPSVAVPSIQVEKNLPKLQASKTYNPAHSIVRLYRDGEFFCSGVVIGSNYVLTASHCLVDKNGLIEHGGKIVVENDNQNLKVEARAVGVNLRLDWGLLQGNFSAIPGATVMEVGFQIEPSVAACGYPQGAKALTCQILTPRTNDGFLVKCSNGMLFPGVSGGPVFDSKMRVVGLNILAYDANEGGGGVAYSPTTGILANFHIAD